MNSYERSIGLKTIYLTLIRRLLFIVLIFVPIAFGSFIATNFLMTKTYVSNVVMSKTTVFNASTYNLISVNYKKTELLSSVLTKLSEDEIKHSNGTPIKESELSLGLSLSALNTSSISVTISFQSRDSKIVQPVLSEYASLAVEVLKNSGGDLNTLSITSNASEHKKNSREDKYFLIALAAGAVLALGIPFVYEIFADEVYDKDDLKAFGVEGFEIKA